jgi:hypothetical protein
VWVNRGRYLVLSLRNNQKLNEENWKHSIAPGAKIAMSFTLRKLLTSLTDANEERCPETSCSGTWKRSKTQTLATWYAQFAYVPKCDFTNFQNSPVCRKEVYTSILVISNAIENYVGDPSKQGSESSGFASRQTTHVLYYGPQDKKSEPEKEPEDEDISLFTRVAQEILDVGDQRAGQRLYPIKSVKREQGSGDVEGIVPSKYRHMVDEDFRNTNLKQDTEQSSKKTQRGSGRWAESSSRYGMGPQPAQSGSRIV